MVQIGTKWCFMARTKAPPTLADLGMSAAEAQKIEDLREGFIGAPAHRVIAQAVDFYVTHCPEPEVKRRYEEARDKRKKS